MSVLNLVAFILIAMACRDNAWSIMFWVAVLASVLTGMSQGFGEALFLSFTRRYPSYTIGYVSAGTGAAGIFATGTLLLVRYFKVSNHALFLMEMPTVLIYFLAFKWLDVQMKTHG